MEGRSEGELSHSRMTFWDYTLAGGEPLDGAESGSAPSFAQEAECLPRD